MSLSEKLNALFSSAHQGAKSASVKATCLVLRVLTGFFLGLTISLIAQELTGFGMLAFIFVLISVFAVFMKISVPWRLATILVFDLICILVAQLLRMYILLAP